MPAQGRQCRTSEGYVKIRAARALGFDLMSIGISETIPPKIQGIRIILRRPYGVC